MSTPLTAPKPDMPTGSSNPVSWKSWFTKIGDWIGGLSPSGVTAYDTGWINIGLAAGVTGQLRYRRVGHEVEVQASVAGSFVVGATQISAAALPAAVCPSGNRRGGLGLSGSNTGVLGVTASGVVFVIHSSGATRAAADGSCTYLLG